MFKNTVIALLLAGFLSVSYANYPREGTCEFELSRAKEAVAISGVYASIRHKFDEKCHLESNGLPKNRTWAECRLIWKELQRVVD